jgi:hypothetical protein
MTAPRAALAALLQTHPMFAPIEDDTASPTQREMDEHNSRQRRERAAGLADWLLSHGVTPALAPPRAPSEEIEPIKDAILSAHRAMRQIIRVGGDGVRVGRAAKIRTALDDATERMDHALRLLTELALPPRAGPWLTVERLTEILAELYQRPEGSTLAEEATWLLPRLAAVGRERGVQDA